MKIRKTTDKDLKRVMEIYVYARKFMAEHGNPNQWGKDIEPTYKTIDDGEWIGNDSYGVVHRIASDGSEKGIGSFCIKWALEQCGHLRIDTHGDNKVMQGMLKKLGFTHCGTIYVYEDNDPRLAFEKITSS